MIDTVLLLTIIITMTAVAVALFALGQTVESLRKTCDNLRVATQILQAEVMAQNRIVTNLSRDAGNLWGPLNDVQATTMTILAEQRAGVHIRRDEPELVEKSAGE